MLKITKIKIILLLLIFSILTLQVEALSIYPSSTEDVANITQIEQANTIVGTGLYSETLFEVRLSKDILTKNNPSFRLTVDFLEQEKFFGIDYFNLTVCEGRLSRRSSDFTKINFNCDHEIDYSIKDSMSNGKTIEIGLGNIKEQGILIKLDYRIPSDFLIQNGNYNIAWFRTDCNGNIACPEPENIIRYLKLPSKNSILEEWTNFNIERMIHEKWVLSTKGYGEAIVWFRDASSETKEKIKWMTIGLFLAFCLSLIQPFFQKKFIKLKSLKLKIIVVIIILVLIYYIFFYHV